MYLTLPALFFLKRDLVISWGEWPSGLRRLGRIRRFTIQSPIGARLGLRTQLRYEAPGNLWVKTR